MNIRARFFVWAVLFLLLCPLVADAQTSLPFVKAMQNSAQEWRGEIPELKRSATAVAGKLIAGGNLYVAPTQQSFQIEVLGRSGGLTMVKVLSDKTELGPNDTVLCALDPGTDASKTVALLERVRNARAGLLVFAGPSRSELSGTVTASLFPRRVFSKTPYASSPGIESVNNVIGEWTWMAALVQACVEQGKMPSAFVSNAMPGGGERNSLLRKQAFHTKTRVTAQDVHDLPQRYLNVLRAALEAMNETQVEAFAQGARLIRQTTGSGHKVFVAYMGHMFPYEFNGPGRPNWQVAAKTQVDAVVPAELVKGDVLLLIGYQSFPWNLTTALREKQIKSVITTSMPPLDDWANDSGIAYINPFWSVQDAAISVRGYDVNILPVSGVMQSTVYWQLAGLTK